MPKPPKEVGLRRLILPLLAAGFLLRLWFVLHHAFLAGDSFLYQDIAQSWLHKGIYGFSTGDSARPTLIRLPGYPMILAALAWLFDPLRKAPIATLQSFAPLFALQITADLATCWLVSSIARRIAGLRAGIAALAMASLCPFMANYTAVPLTETFTLFFLALAFYALQRWLSTQQPCTHRNSPHPSASHSEQSEESRGPQPATKANPLSAKDPHARRLFLLVFALAWSILLRPDQGLLAAVLVLALWLAAKPRSLRSPILCAALIALPFVPWTVRNYRTFHVVQPLAPKQATDPWETAPVDFQRWFRTWAIDFTATQDVYWHYPESPVDIHDLPSRAFDSQEEYNRTEVLLKTAADEGKLTPQVEAGFRQLANRRIAAHPALYYVVLPVERVANMLLHPRTEMLPVAERWWQYRQHPAQTLFAWTYAALNLAYILAAIAGFKATLERQRPLALAMAGYIVLRCLLLLTLDNAEQRYTFEFFPILIVFAGGLFASRQTRAHAA